MPDIDLTLLEASDRLKAAEKAAASASAAIVTAKNSHEVADADLVLAERALSEALKQWHAGRTAEQGDYMDRKRPSACERTARNWRTNPFRAL